MYYLGADRTPIYSNEFPISVETRMTISPLSRNHGGAEERDGRDCWAARRVLVLGQGVMLVSLCTIACRAPAVTRSEPPSRKSVQTLQLRLPPSLDGECAQYRLELSRALDEVAEFFRSSGFDHAPQGLVDSVIVFDGISEARVYLAEAIGARPEDIPRRLPELSKDEPFSW